MENQENINISGSTRELFRSSAAWMRTFAILMIIGLSICALAVLIVSAADNAEFMKALTENTKSEIAGYISQTMGLILFGSAGFIVIYGYAVIKLLSAANKFTAISYNVKKETLVQAFKSLKTFWMYYGISFIFLVVIGIILFVRLYNLIMAAAAQS